MKREELGRTLLERYTAEEITDGLQRLIDHGILTISVKGGYQLTAMGECVGIRKILGDQLTGLRNNR
jgi:hypothetical protein